MSVLCMYCICSGPARFSCEAHQTEPCSLKRDRPLPLAMSISLARSRLLPFVQCYSGIARSHFRSGFGSFSLNAQQAGHVLSLDRNRTISFLHCT
jgi:hypothetical protein